MAQPLTDEERGAVQRFLGIVRDVLPEQDASAILFGSRARGEGGPDSDVDVLVLVTTDDAPVRRCIFDLAYEVFLKTDVLILPLVLSRHGFTALKRDGQRLARDIEREGVAV